MPTREVAIIILINLIIIEIVLIVSMLLGVYLRRRGAWKDTLTYEPMRGYWKNKRLKNYLRKSFNEFMKAEKANRKSKEYAKKAKKILGKNQEGGD